MSRWLYQLLRIFLALLLLVTSIGKLVDNRAFAESLADYDLGMPPGMLLAVGLAVALAELLLAVALLARLRPRATAVAVVLLMLVYTLVVLVTVWRSVWVGDCGCFGVFGAIQVGPELLATDAALLVLSLVHCLAAWRHGLPRQRNVFRTNP